MPPGPTVGYRDDMRAIAYDQTGPSSVLRLVDRPVPTPGEGEVLVRLEVSGVNPTDWKSRSGMVSRQDMLAEQVPNQDGAGVIEAVGPAVTTLKPGQRVWIWEAAWHWPHGTAAEYTVVPARHAVPLPDQASFDLGASLGIPALTAHRCLTVHPDFPDRLSPGSLTGAQVLVIGGAGAVGNAAIQLARWAGADVLATVSTAAKADLAWQAGAQHVINYREDDVVARVRAAVPGGIDMIVEVSPVTNAALYPGLLGAQGTVAIYAFGGGEEWTLPIQSHFMTNTRFQIVLVYTVSQAAKDAAVADVAAAVAAGAFDVGEQRGLPLHRFTLAETAQAHDAVENGAVGKVLIDVRR